MKHTMKIMLPFLMIAGLLTGCGSQESIDTTAETTQATEAVTTAAVTEKETQTETEKAAEMSEATEETKSENSDNKSLVVYFTPAENRIPRVRTVTRALPQKAPLASCFPRGTAFDAASPTVHVENLRALKSNALLRTAKMATAITMNPIQIASQSSFFQRSEVACLVLIFQVYYTFSLPP